MVSTWRRKLSSSEGGGRMVGRHFGDFKIGPFRFFKDIHEIWIDRVEAPEIAKGELFRIGPHVGTLVGRIGRYTVMREHRIKHLCRGK